MTIDAADLQLPEGCEFVRATPEFKEGSVPAALRSAHRIADGVWGRLVVTDGGLWFTFESDPQGRRRLAAGDHQVIPPVELHRVEVDGPVRFLVEFHRARS
jgi:tellurite methyltransferase